MILWGRQGSASPPGRLTAHHFNADFILISAILAGVKEIRAAVERAKVNQGHGRQPLLFVDEARRFNKERQDAFLPHVVASPPRFHVPTPRGMEDQTGAPAGTRPGRRAGEKEGIARHPSAGAW